MSKRGSRSETKNLLPIGDDENAPPPAPASDNRQAMGVMTAFALAMFCLGAVGLIVIGIVGIDIWRHYHIYNYLYALPLTGNDGLGVDGAPLLSIGKCTNYTGSSFPFEIENKEGYVISYRCQETKNRCETAVCTTNGTCAQVVIPGGQCSSDTECPAAYRCNLDNCSCVQQVPCLVDGDCPVLDNPCAAFVCATNGTCVEQLNGGATCSNSDQCMLANDNPFYRCNLTTCACAFMAPVEMNMTCIDNTTNPVPLNQCAQFLCVNGIYVESLVPGAECAYSEACQATNNNTFYICNSTCDCQFMPPTPGNITCSTNATCPSSDLNNCSAFICVAGRCEEILVPAATCAYDAQCEQINGTDYYCNIASCTCQIRPLVIPTVTFISTASSAPFEKFFETNITFQNATITVGDVFYSHGSNPWTAVTFPNTASGADYYIAWFEVAITGITNTAGAIQFWMSSNSLSITSAIPGCSFQFFNDGGSLSVSSILTASGFCMFPGYPYAQTGIFLVGTADTNLLEGNLAQSPYSAVWTIQKVS